MRVGVLFTPIFFPVLRWHWPSTSDISPNEKTEETRTGSGGIFLELKNISDEYFPVFLRWENERHFLTQSLSVKVICFDLTLITASTTTVSVHIQMDQESAMMIFLSYQKLRMPTFSKISSRVNAMVNSVFTRRTSTTNRKSFTRTFTRSKVHCTARNVVSRLFSILLEKKRTNGIFSFE